MLSNIIPGAPPAVIYVVAFAVIFSLLALFALVAKRLWGGRLTLPGQDRGRARQPRLGIVDVYDLDKQRQLILLRRDNVEHLLLVGGPNDVVVERSIIRVPGARLSGGAAEYAVEAERSAERPPEPARPVIETPREPAVAARLGPVDLQRADPAETAQELAPVLASPPAPAPARIEPVLKPDNVALQTARLTAPPPAPSAPPPAPPTPPPAPELRAPEPRPAPPPRPAPATTRPPEPARAPPQAVPSPAPPPAAPPSAPPIPPREPRPADAAVLSDMARQLEEALKRPLSAVRPSEVAQGHGPEPAAPPRPVPEPPRAPSVAPPRPSTGARVAPPMGDVPGVMPPAASAPPPSLPPRPAAAPPPHAPQPAPPAVQAAQSAQAVPTARDPFSVDDIEAEFARLLNRPEKS